MAKGTLSYSVASARSPEARMIYYDPDDAKASPNADPFRDDRDERASARLPASAQRTLDEIAAALNVTTGLLQHDASLETHAAGPASLAEASTLLQAFIQIRDPEMRRRCLAFVQAAAIHE
jgi:hypothetical protein